MKKILILTIAMFTLFSCSSSDEENIEKDPFIGSWSLFSINGQEVDDCYKKNTVIILENGNLTTTSYDVIDDECKLDDTSASTWENKGNGNYGITRVGSTEENVTKVTFSNNTFTFTETVENTSETSTFKRK